MTVHRGGTSQRPDRLGATFPVKAGETILSGMIMTPVRNASLSRNEWVRGYAAGSSLPNSFYVAVDDSTDGDSVTSGGFQGLSVRGSYEISTSAFNTTGDHTDLLVGTNYRTGDALTYDAASGNFKPATTGDMVIAHVVKDYNPPVNLGATYTGLLPFPANTVSEGVQGGIYIRPKESNAQDLNRIRIELVPPYKLPA